MLDGLSPSQERKILHPHQIEAIDLVKSSLGKGYRRVVLQGPVGFGKTVVAARIIEGALAKGYSVIFTVPMLSLINQTIAAFEAEGMRGIGVMQANHPRTDPLARVQIASVQTLGRREIPHAALVIVDEAHIRAKVIEELMAERPDVYFLGLSATPWAKGMGLTWQDLVVPCSVGGLIEGGYLSKFTVFAPDVPDLSRVRVERGDYAETQLAEVMGEAKLVGSVVQTWLEKGEDRPTLVFGVNCAHALRLSEEFISAGVAAAYVDGHVDTVMRASIFDQFRAGEVRVICSVRTMTTGIDLPVSCICDAAPTQSEMLHCQKIGRGLRVNPGTEELVVFDHAGNSLRLGLITDTHHTELDRSKPGERQQKAARAKKLPTPCGACGVLVSGRFCPACGAERKPFSTVEHSDGELIQITGNKAQAPTMAVKEERLAGLLWIAQERRYKPGWAARQFKDWHGHWPANGMNPTPSAPSREVSNWVKSQDIRYAKRMAKQRSMPDVA